jgi:hypothetical protein
VREAIHGRRVANADALADPRALAAFEAYAGRRGART